MSEKAFILCRISDQKQADGYSLDAQEKCGIEYAHKKNFQIMKLFSFIETASKDAKRSKFEAMMKEISSFGLKNKGTIHLIVEKPDRLTRNFSSQEKIQLLVIAGKLTVHYYKDNKIFDSNCSPSEIFCNDIQTAVSKYHSGNLSRESKKGMHEKATQGWFPALAPYGYINARRGDTDKHGRRESKIFIDTDTRMVETVKRIYELRAVNQLSYCEIRDRIVEEGLLPPERTKHFSKSGVEGILKNTFYGGHYTWQGEVFKGKHELFVPREHFDAVHNSTKLKYTRIPRGLFSGFFTCADPECGCHILYDPKSKRLRKSGKEITYHYYHCSDGKKIHSTRNEKQINLSEPNLLEQLSRPVREISITAQLAEAISKALKLAHEKTMEAHKRNLAGYKQAIRTTEQQEDEVYSHFAKGIIDETGYKRQIERIRTDKIKYEQLLY